MKKEKLSVVFIVLVIMFIIFVAGIFVGKKLTPAKPKEGIINESSLKNTIGNKNDNIPPVPSEKIKFKPLSNLASLKKQESAQKPVKKSLPEPKTKTIVKTKIVYVKKPVYVYKYKYKYIKPKSVSPSSPFSPKIYYTIQVAALKNIKAAKMLADKLNSMGFFAYLVPINISGKRGKATYQQVMVGKFTTRNGAKIFEKTIAKKFNVKPYIIKIN